MLATLMVQKFSRDLHPSFGQMLDGRRAKKLCEALIVRYDASRFVALGERHTKGFPARTPVFRFEWRN